MPDFKPIDILCYICSEASRKPRFLMALAMGIPIIDAASFDDPTVIHKSKTLDYAYLHLKPLNPSVNDVERLFDEPFKKILVETYENYSLAFIQQFIQAHRLILPFQLMVVGDFTFEHDVEDVNNTIALCEYALFLVQCGAKVMIVLDRDQDDLFQDIAVKKITSCIAFKRYVVRPRAGETAAERYSEQIAKMKAAGDVAPVCVEERSSAETCPGA